jgi:spore germination cell wall hydrolase CwlJ-like protein
VKKFFLLYLFAFPALADDCVARALYWEAHGAEGMRAVAQVIANRVQHPGFPKTPCAVVYERRRDKCQFEWVCVHNRRPPPNEKWRLAQRIAQEPIEGNRNGVLFFHASWVKTRWRHLEQVAEVEGNIFYRKP